MPFAAGLRFLASIGGAALPLATAACFSGALLNACGSDDCAALRRQFQPVAPTAATPAAVKANTERLEAVAAAIEAPPVPVPVSATETAPDQATLLVAASSRPAARSGPLANFYAALDGLTSGARRKTVTVLHLGDSHIASDSLSRGMRRLLQAKFGDAGRGLLQPFGAAPYQNAAGLDLKVEGDWTFGNSLKLRTGPYGLTGVRATSQSADAAMSLSSGADTFDWAEVTVVSGPSEGSIRIAAGGQEAAYSAQADRQGSRTIRITGRGSSLVLRPQGDGPVTVLGWAVGKNRPGLRYVSLGIVGASVATTKAWDPGLVKTDVARLAPDLIILGYGTNEALDNDLEGAAYERLTLALIAELKTAAPKASLVIVTPPDIARRAPDASADADPCGGAPSVTAAVAPVGGASAAPNQGPWLAPAKLQTVRAALQNVARQSGAFVWDWSRAMGGPCAIERWSSAKPPLAEPDHVHQTQAGYDRSSRALFEALMQGYARPAKLTAAAPN